MRNTANPVPSSRLSTDRLFRLLAPVLLICLCSVPGRAQSLTSPGRSGQFNRIGAVMTVAEAYTASAAASLGGAANLEVDMNNACAGANVGMQNSGTGIYIDIVAYYQVAESDPGSLHTVLSDLNGVWTDADNFAFVTNGAGILQCVVNGTDDAGLSYECWKYGTVSSVYGAWYSVFAHELGRNCCLQQGDDVSKPNTWLCMMLQNYCGGATIAYFSNPSVYYDGVQLLGTTNNDCGQGPLANQGNNSRQFALNGPNYVGTKPVALSSLNVFNPLLTAVNCGGAAVATQAADQRTFAADQNYSGGTASDLGGYTYTVDVSGVTNPAPPTAYQDYRYGNMAYTFNDYRPGSNYLVRLHFMENYWSASGQREFNVFINGRQVLTNFDIFATAGAKDRAVIKEFTTTANASGQIVITFANVVDNAVISAIEILQGGLYVPLNLAATATNDDQISLSWSPVAGATSYNVKRSTVSGGPYTTIANVASTSHTDTAPATGVTYYYVVSAVNGGNESFNSLEADATSISVAVPNYGFEIPATTSYVYNPSGASWTFSGASPSGSGVTTDGSGFTSGNTSAPQGTQVGFIQETGTISQPISGFTSGANYTLSFAVSQRQNKSGGQSGETIDVKMGNTFLAQGLQPPQANAGYVTYYYHFTATAGTQILAFNGTDLNGGDNTLFVDNVQIIVSNAPPAVPVGLTATAGNAQVALIWTGSPDATYQVKRATVSGGPYTTLASVTTTNYTDTTVTNFTTYYYVVSAASLSGESANSSEVSATPITSPPAPAGLTATATSSSQINLTWTASTGATSYNVKRATVNGGSYSTVATGVSTPSYSDVGLSGSTTYYYVVSGVNSQGESATSTPASAVTLSSGPATTISKANNTTNLNLAGSWVGGVVPDASSVATWDGTVTSANTVALGANLNWGGVKIANPAGPVTITAGNTLTLGVSGIDLSQASQDLTINSGLAIAAGNQAWNVASGHVLSVTGPFTRTTPGATLVVGGDTGTVTFDPPLVNGIVGPWAVVVRSGAGAANSASGYTYATVGSGNVVPYTGATLANFGWTSSNPNTFNYDITGPGGGGNQLGVNRTANTARYVGPALTQYYGNNNTTTITLNGLMNAGTGPLTFAQHGPANTANSFGQLIIGANNELVLFAASADIEIEIPILDGSAASALTIAGAGGHIVTLSDANTYSGNTMVNGNLRLGAVNAIPGGSGKGDVIVNGTMDLNGFSQSINGLSGSGFVDNTSATAATLNVGNNNATGTFSGVIKNSGGALTLVKTGSGTLTLAGGNTYTGSTIINGGALMVNGSMGATPVTVANSAVLGGYGVIGGPVTIQSGATLVPGANAAPVGTLTVSNSVTLQAGSFTRMRIVKSPSANNDLLRVNGASSVLSYGGTLILTNLSGTVTAGDSFPLFSATSYAGAFFSISPATPGVGLLWNTNNLTVNGTLSVQLGSVNPQFGSVSLVGTNMVFSGSGGAAACHYSVLSSTNLAVPLGSWDVIGTGDFDTNGGFIFTNGLDAQSSQRFYTIHVP